jgi:hypothetical protein
VISEITIYTYGSCVNFEGAILSAGQLINNNTLEDCDKAMDNNMSFESDIKKKILGRFVIFYD